MSKEVNDKERNSKNPMTIDSIKKSVDELIKSQEYVVAQSIITNLKKAKEIIDVMNEWDKNHLKNDKIPETEYRTPLRNYISYNLSILPDQNIDNRDIINTIFTISENTPEAVSSFFTMYPNLNAPKKLFTKFVERAINNSDDEIEIATIGQIINIIQHYEHYQNDVIQIVNQSLIPLENDIAKRLHSLPDFFKKPLKLLQNTEYISLIHKLLNEFSADEIIKFSQKNLQPGEYDSQATKDEKILSLKITNSSVEAKMKAKIKEELNNKISHSDINKLTREDLSNALIKKPPYQNIYKETKADHKPLIDEIEKNIEKYNITKHAVKIISKESKEESEEEFVLLNRKKDELEKAIQNNRKNTSYSQASESLKKLLARKTEIEAINYRKRQKDKESFFRIETKETKSKQVKLNKELQGVNKDIVGARREINNINENVKNLEMELTAIKKSIVVIEGLALLTNDDFYILGKRLQETNPEKAVKLFEISWNYGKNPDAAYVLSEIYANSQGDVAADPQKSKDFLLKAGRGSHPKALENDAINNELQKEKNLQEKSREEYNKLVADVVNEDLFEIILEKITKESSLFKRTFGFLKNTANNIVKKIDLNGENRKIEQEKTIEENKKTEKMKLDIIEKNKENLKLELNTVRDSQNNIKNRELAKYEFNESNLEDNLNHNIKLGFDQDACRERMKKTAKILQNPVSSDRSHAHLVDKRRLEGSLSDQDKSLLSGQDMYSIAMELMNSSKKEDKLEALDYFKDSAEYGKNPDAFWQLSEIYNKRGNPKKSQEYLLEAALLGQSNALSKSGVKEFISELRSDLALAQKEFNEKVENFVGKKFDDLSQVEMNKGRDQKDELDRDINELAKENSFLEDSLIEQEESEKNKKNIENIIKGKEEELSEHNEKIIELNNKNKEIEVLQDNLEKRMEQLQVRKKELLNKEDAINNEIDNLIRDGVAEEKFIKEKLLEFQEDLAKTGKMNDINLDRLSYLLEDCQQCDDEIWNIILNLFDEALAKKDNEVLIVIFNNVGARDQASLIEDCIGGKKIDIDSMREMIEPKPNVIFEKMIEYSNFNDMT